ncbi:MAG: hypothetical protein AAF442_00115 [Pseudomonadota bacterium]
MSDNGKPRYAPPTKDEFVALLLHYGLKQAEVSRILAHANTRRVRAWYGGQGAIHFTGLYTLAHKATGVAITPSGWREELGVREIMARAGFVAR